MATAPPESAAARAERVIAVMSAFHPEEAAVANGRTALAQADELIVVDDGSGEAADGAAAALVEAGATVIRSSANRGIAAALNDGVAAAAAREHDYILYLDQDSSLPAGFVDALVEAHRSSGGVASGVAGAAPEYFGTVRQGRASRVCPVVPMPIQSGLLLHREVVEHLGPLREDFFIDLVDFDYALRLADAGLRVAAASKLVLPHRLGRQVGLTLLGRRLGPRSGFTVSTPFRYYYRVRNRVFLIRAHWRGHLIRMVVDVALDLRHAVIVLAAARRPSALLHVMLAGWRDGLRGRGGRMPAALRERAQTIEWRHPQ